MHVHFESFYIEKVIDIVLIVENMKKSFPRNVFLSQQLNIPLL